MRALRLFFLSLPLLNAIKQLNRTYYITEIPCNCMFFQKKIKWSFPDDQASLFDNFINQTLDCFKNIDYRSKEPPITGFFPITDITIMLNNNNIVAEVANGGGGPDDVKECEYLTYSLQSLSSCAAQYSPAQLMNIPDSFSVAFTGATVCQPSGDPLQIAFTICSLFFMFSLVACVCKYCPRTPAPAPQGNGGNNNIDHLRELISTNRLREEQQNSGHEIELPIFGASI